MARLEHLHPALRAALLAMECPTFDTHPWAGGPTLDQPGTRLSMVLRP